MNSSNEDKTSHISSSVEINVLDLARYIFNHRLWVITITLAFTTISIIWGFFVSKPLYKSHSIINVNLSSKSNSISMGRISYWFEEQETLNKIFLTEQFFTSRKYRDALLDEVLSKSNLCQEVDLCSHYKKVILKYLFSLNVTEDEFADTLVSHLEIFSDSEKYTMTISSQTPDPYLSVALADLASIVLVELNQKVLSERTSRVKKFLEVQTEETREELEKIEKELVGIQKDQTILASDEVRSKLNSVYIEQKQKSDDLKKEFYSTSLFLNELKFEMNEIRERMASQNAESQLYLSQVQKRFDLLKYQMAVKSMNREPGNIKDIDSSQLEMKQYQNLLRNSKTEVIASDPWKYLRELEGLVSEVKRKKIQLGSQLKAIDESKSLDSGQFKNIPETFRKISALQRNIRLTTEIYTLLKTRLAETQIQEAGRTNDLVIMSYSEKARNSSGVGLSRKVIVASTVGLSLSLMGLFLAYVLIPTVRNKTDLEMLGLKVVGEYKIYKGSRVGLMIEKAKPVVLAEQFNSFDANSIRYTRFRIENSLGLSKGSEKRNGKIISACSVNSGEGKSYTTANLAYAFNTADYKTLVIDCDFEKTDIKNYFNDFHEPDSLKLMNEDSRINFVRVQVKRNLHLVFANHFTNSAVDYVESLSFSRFLEALREEYDIIILDSPPMKGHLTPILLAGLSDAVYFVANQRATIREDIYFNISKLRETFNGPIFGILNFVYEDISGTRKKKKIA